MLTNTETKKLKLSDAIRLGAMLKPQYFGNFYGDGGSCALGAAADSCGLVAEDFIDIERQWPITTQYVKCPVPLCREFGDDIATSMLSWLIAHLNDDHLWTREKIADFIASLEAAQAHEQPASCDAVREDVGQPVVCPRV